MYSVWRVFQLTESTIKSEIVALVGRGGPLLLLVRVYVDVEGGHGPGGAAGAVLRILVIQIGLRPGGVEALLVLGICVTCKKSNAFNNSNKVSRHLSATINNRKVLARRKAVLPSPSGVLCYRSIASISVIFTQ